MDNDLDLSNEVSRENEELWKEREDETKQLKRFYQLIFKGQDGYLSEAGESVMDDLKLFCDGDSFSSDPLDMARKAGRRQVYQMILKMLIGD